MESLTKEMRKSSQARELERRHGQPIKDIVVAALTKHGTIESAARSLEVNPNTFYGWMIRLRIQVKKVAEVA
ncbi:MAG: hypothetical protein M1482_10910 [Chloroflexi bacterium]|nr:hypothetical protein [Chloroflexota bacterium]